MAKRHVYLCLSCLRILALDGRCGCATPQAMYLSETEAKRTMARRKAEDERASKHKGFHDRLPGARKGGR